MIINTQNKYYFVYKYIQLALFINITMQQSSSSNQTKQGPNVIKSFFIDRKVIDVVYCGDETKNIMTLTDDGQIFTTYDFGQTWSNTKAKLDQLHSTQSIKVISMNQNPIDLQTVLLIDF